MMFRFKPGAEVSSTDPFYDLLKGGYICPRELLEDKDQADQVLEAIGVVTAFLAEAEAAGVLEVG